MKCMSSAPIPEWRNVDLRVFREEIVPLYRPALMRGLVGDWPAVAAADPAAYLAAFDRGAEAEAFVGSPEIEGRYFYKSDMSGFNFERRKGRLAEILRTLVELKEAERPPGIYVGAAATAECLPGFAEQNPLPLVEGTDAAARVWIGNRSVVSTHFDLSDNLACVVAGRRRFTLFPPDQLANLYVGPLDYTMAGQPASMVELNKPDFERFPRFREALAASLSAELGPGDALYIPTLWWHQIEALDPLNILVNYWWEDAPADRGSMFEAMVHAIYAAGTVPPARLAAWRGMFDHYVFREHGEPAAHLDPAHRGILAESAPPLRQRFRQFLLRGLGMR
jgi:hypothetical protein